MNYRHAFHAGNAADVLKHVVLVRILARLAAKPKPFRVIDTHAGAGLYHLASGPAARTAEWREGIGRLEAAPLPPAAEALIAPYRAVLAATRARHGADAYPGSPEIARCLLGPDDRLIAVESERDVARDLARILAGDPRAKAVTLDGWTALGAYIPPPERRGVVLIDPPYERPDEFETVLAKVSAAWRKWETGMFAVWYPLADAALAERFLRGLVAANPPKLLAASLVLDPERRRGGLPGSGMAIVNPPFGLDGDLAVLLPALATAMGDERAEHRLVWLVRERGGPAR